MQEKMPKTLGAMDSKGLLHSWLGQCTKAESVRAFQGQALVGEVASLRASAAETARQLDELRMAQAKDQETYEQLNTAFEEALHQLDTVSSSMDEASKLHDTVSS